MITVIVGVVAFVAGYEVKAHLASGTLAKVKAEIAKAESAAVTDAKALIAKLKSVL